MGNGKVIMVTVLPKRMFKDDFSIFEAQAIIPPPTIYSGVYPTIKINTDTITDRTEDLKGSSINGIITEEQWYIKDIESKDVFGGIGL